MKLRTRLFQVCLPLGLVYLCLAVPNASPQTNSWISPTRGYWDDYTKWSLGVAPSTNAQTLIQINNDATKTVTIDSYTATDFPSTMIVSDLVLSAPGVALNTLELVDISTNTPLRVLDTFSITAGGELYLANSAILMEGFTNSALVVDGSAILDVGSVLNVSLSLYSGLDPSALGSLVLTGGQLILTSGPPAIIAAPPSAIGINGVAQMIVSNGQVQSATGGMFVGSGQGSTGTLVIAGGSVLCAPYSRLVVGMETGAVGLVSVTKGSLIVTNSFNTLIGCDGYGELDLLGGTNSFGAMEVGGDPTGLGTLTIAGGVNSISAGLSVGTSIGATGTVFMSGGQLIDTNVTSTIGPWGYGILAISNGTWLGSTLNLGVHAVPAQSNVTASSAYGEIDISGGTMTLYSQLAVGTCPSGGVGVVNITGGALYVTNAAHNAVLNLRDGQVNLNGGFLQIDTLVWTNIAGTFIRGNGTLVIRNFIDIIPNSWKAQYGLSLVDPTLASTDSDGDGMNNQQEYLAGTDPTNSASSFRITSVLPSGRDIRLTWNVVTNKSYIVQAANGSPSATFTYLGTVIIPASPPISQTNFFDVGGLNYPGPRFYRIQLVTQ
ncbi:MAG TPA: hypothetical protein VMP11_19950 [Verrucomicrobiae bacterium]|nr:hypothetical protein [Verrucomicrobiae bacterium]